MGTPWLWIEFNACILVALALDLGVFHRRARRVSLREAAAWSALWIGISIAFGFAIFQGSGRQPALEFFTGYLIEKALSVDNLFVFLLVFRTFSVEESLQHRVLAWGLIGALLMRGAMIAVGAALLAHFSWVLYVFGGFLLYAGAHMLLEKGKEIHPERSRFFLWAQRAIPLSPDKHAARLFAREGGRWLATRLFLVLLVVELADVTFALDSIPAVFGITRDPFIVYTSNVLAILGLRSLYFLLAGALPYFRFLGTGLSAVLMFVGAKLLAENWFHVPTHISLFVVGGILAVAVAASVLVKQRGAPSAGTDLTKRIFDSIAGLASGDAAARRAAAHELFQPGKALAESAAKAWLADRELASLFVRDGGALHTTVGIAVRPETFARIRNANSLPSLAEVPPDQDAEEFELDFPGGVRLDILTTKAPNQGGAIARFLEKRGEGIQQVELAVTNVDRATELLRTRLGYSPIYPQTRPGADGTRVNFFLVTSTEGQKVLIELVETPRG
ncbi:MAG TPA: TerC/Alx family metal homeostasis membrane protein [Candidatus Acidoferrales bacterium]|nr:TerC/Alx family metal homeostasis membrane protein [Candidatus Acidoferrales bacterium]